MFPSRGRHAGLTAVLAGVLLAGVLPASALAAAPIAVDDHLSVPVDGPSTGLDLLANDTDTDGDPLTITATTAGSHGVVVITSGGTSLAYQPDVSFHGTDTFSYTITDGVETDAGTVILDVNSPPIAVDDPSDACFPLTNWGGAYPVPEDYVGTMSPRDQTIVRGNCGLLHNDTDPDGDVLTYEIVDQPGHGEAFPYPGDVFGYRADANYSTAAGTEPGGQWVSDSFTYRAFDGYAYSPPATMKFWVAPINDAPTFTPGGTVTVVENSGQYRAAWATNVSPGPFEPNQAVHFEPGGPVSVVVHGLGPLFVTQPTLDSGGILTFAVGPDSYGVARVTVFAKDDGGLEHYGWAPLPLPDDTSADVTFDIVVKQAAVTAVDDIAWLPEDPETYPIQGVPYPNPWPIHVLANDTFPPGSRITSVTQGIQGNVTIAPDGLAVLYGPNVNVNGSDSFTYTLADGAGSTDTATVSVSITPTNDAPVAVADSINVAEEAAATDVPVLANDSDVDGDTLTILRTTDATKGVVLITGGGTGLTYQPNPDATGSDSFTYAVSDGFPIGGGLVATDTATVSVVISPVNDSPVAAADSLAIAEDAMATDVPVLTNDTDPDGDTRTITAKSDGIKGVVVVADGGTSLTYKPNADANGSDSFTYTISDGHGGTSTATVSVTISPVNDSPVAAADSLAIAEDADATHVPVLTNDTDPDGDIRTITAKTDGNKGVVLVADGGTGLTYKPNADANRSDSFTYTISDGHGGTSTATVSVTISATNDRPVAAGDLGFTLPENAGSTAFAVMANDTDADGDTLTITGTSRPTHGTITVTGGGTGLNYDPAQFYFGTDVFTYTIGDGHGGSDTATVLLTVVRDATNPAVSGPAERFLARPVGSTTSSMRLSWFGADVGGTGIGGYTLQGSVDGRRFSTIALASAASTSVDRTLTDGRTYRFRVRATDREGNVSAYVYGPTFKPARIQDTNSSVGFVGSWVTRSTSAALGGSVRHATSRRARASITRTVRDVAWVATKTPTSGSAQVWVDGVLAATVNLRSRSTTYRRLAFQRHFSTLASHTLEIRLIGGGRIDLDAFLIAR